MQYLQGLRDFLYYWFINKKGFGKPEASMIANQVSRLKAELLLALLSLCVDLILKSLTSLELRSCASSDLCCSACLRVAACSCSSLRSLECTETYELNLALSLKLIRNCLDECVKNCLGILLGSTSLCSHSFY